MLTSDWINAQTFVRFLEYLFRPISIICMIQGNDAPEPDMGSFKD